MSTYPFQVPSGTGFIPNVSGTNDLGSATRPFRNLYTDDIYSNNFNGQQVSMSVFYEIPSGDIDSVNTSYTLANTPISGSLRLFYNGVMIMPSGFGIPTQDYYVSGSSITTFYAPTSGSSLVAFYNYY